MQNSHFILHIFIMAKNMTFGNPNKILITFALPMVIGNIFQQLYNISDSIIIGNFLGSNSLAAVGVSYPITFLFISIASGLSIGSSVVISQMFGSKNYIEMKNSIYTSLISLIFLSILLTICGVFSSHILLRLLKTPYNIFSDANLYLKVYFLGLLPMFLYNGTTSVFNALGDSKTPLYLLIFSSVLNIALDLLFVTIIQLGILGIAFATFTAQLVSAILSIIFLKKKIKIGFNQEINNKISLHIDINILKKINKIAIPTMLQQSTVSLGLILVQALVNSYGADIVSGYTAATKIDSLAVMPIINLSNAVSTFTAQNAGAKLIDRIKEGYKAALKLTLIFSISITIILFVYGKNLIDMFVDSSANFLVIATGIEYLRTVSLGYTLKGISSTANGILKGCGDMKFFLLSTLSNFGIRVFAAYSLSSLIGQKAIWYSIPIGWSIELLISNYRYFSGKWTQKIKL